MKLIMFSNINKVMSKVPLTTNLDLVRRNIERRSNVSNLLRDLERNVLGVRRSQDRDLDRSYVDLLAKYKRQYRDAGTALQRSNAMMRMRRAMDGRTEMYEAEYNAMRINLEDDESSEDNDYWDVLPIRRAMFRQMWDRQEYLWTRGPFIKDSDDNDIDLPRTMSLYVYTFLQDFNRRRHNYPSRVRIRFTTGGINQGRTTPEWNQNNITYEMLMDFFKEIELYDNADPLESFREGDVFFDVLITRQPEGQAQKENNNKLEGTISFKSDSNCLHMCLWLALGVKTGKTRRQANDDEDWVKRNMEKAKRWCNERGMSNDDSKPSDISKLKFDSSNTKIIVYEAVGSSSIAPIWGSVCHIKEKICDMEMLNDNNYNYSKDATETLKIIYIYLRNNHYDLVSNRPKFALNFDNMENCTRCNAIHTRKMCPQIKCYSCDYQVYSKNKTYEENKFNEHQEKIVNEICNKCNTPIKFEGCWKTHNPDCKQKKAIKHKRKKCNLCTRLNNKPTYIEEERYKEHCDNGHVEEEACTRCKKIDSETGKKKSVYFNRFKVHTCEYIRKETKKSTIEKEIFVYDIESYYGEDGLQKFAMAWFININDTSERYFVENWYELDDTISGLMDRSITMLAHNAKSYDSLIILDNIPWLKVTKMLRPGQRMYSFNVGKITFRDSLLHIGMSLAQSAKYYNLEMTKGIMPYTYFTEENVREVKVISTKIRNKSRKLKDGTVKVYEKEVPDEVETINKKVNFVKIIEYFNEEDQEVIKNNYEYYNDTSIDLWEHVKEYCLKDVLILAQVVTAYRDYNLKQEKIDPFDYVTKAGHAKDVFEKNYLSRESMYYLNKDTVKHFIKPCFYGGHTDCYVQKYDCKTHEKIVCDDISSQYPTVMCEDPLPGKFVHSELCVMNGLIKPKKKRTIVRRKKNVVGVIPEGFQHKFEFSKFNNYLKNLTDNGFCYFATVDVSSPKIFTNYPSLPISSKNNKKLLFPLGKLQSQGFYSTELDYAIRKESRNVTDIYAIIIFKATLGVFKPFMTKYFDIKNNSEGASKASAKVFINSLWGKYGQTNEYLDSVLISEEEYSKYVTREHREEIEIRSEPMRIDKDRILVSFSDSRPSNTSLLTHIACAVTSNARHRLQLGIEKVTVTPTNKLLYVDTDSVIYVTSKDNDKAIKLKGVPTEGMGSWERELYEADQFRCVRPKTYIMRKALKDVKKTTGGFPLKSLQWKHYEEALNSRTRVKIDIGKMFVRKGFTINVRIDNHKLLAIGDDKRKFDKITFESEPINLDEIESY